MAWWRGSRVRRGAEAPKVGPAPLVEFKKAAAAFEQIAARHPLARKMELVDIRLPSILQRYAVTGPVCHVGSKTRKGDEETVRQFRANFGDGCEFVGLDIEAGQNVDVLADICDPQLFEKQPGLAAHFGFAFVSALLEHVEDPFAAARNVTQLLRNGGTLYAAHPWVQGYHAYPDDYWRFSIRGIRKLFPGIEWIDWWYAGNNPGVGLRVKNGDPRNERKFFISVGTNVGLAGLLTDRSLPYLFIGAVGRRVIAP